MTTIREQIIATIAETLADTEGVEGRVWRSRREALARNEASAIVIEPSTEPRQVYAIHKLDASLELAVAVFARGNIPDQIADPIAADAHSRIMADRSVGGLAIDVIPGTVDWQRDGTDPLSLWMVSMYQIRYSTAIDDLTSL